jgi:phage-related protein
MDPRLKVYFFRSDAGREPVREWLKALKPQDRRTIGEDIKTVQFGWPIGMPLVRPLGGGLYETRSDLENTTVRIVFALDGERMILLHAFDKKDKKTLSRHLTLARTRMAKLKRKGRGSK